MKASRGSFLPFEFLAGWRGSFSGRGLAPVRRLLDGIQQMIESNPVLIRRYGNAQVTHPEKIGIDDIELPER
jgi:hypothetical protein